jgi:hypothetical protein
MSFFDSLPARAPAPPPRRARRPAWARSDAVIPGSVAGEVIVARTDQAAVAAGSIRAYPNGFEFMVHIRLRYEDETSGEWAMDPFIRHGRGRSEPDDALRPEEPAPESAAGWTTSTITATQGAEDD